MPKIFKILLIFNLIFCFSLPVDAENHENLYREKIIIGIAAWPGYAPLIIAESKGFFKEQGLDVEIRRYPGLGELSMDYRAKKIHGRANLNFEALKEAFDGLEHQIVLAIDYSDGADAIMAATSIRGIYDLVGKKVGYEMGTLEEFFITWALKENGLKLSDVVAVPATPEEAAKKLQAGEVDVAVTYEPFLSQYLSSSKYQAIYTSNEAPGLITDVLTFHTDFIKNNPKTMEAILRAYFRAYRLIKESPSETNPIIAKEFGVTSENVANQFKGLKLLSLKDNVTAFTFAAGLLSLYGNLQQTAKFIRQQPQYAERQINTEKLIERRFVKKLSREENLQ